MQGCGNENTTHRSKRLGISVQSRNNAACQQATFVTMPLGISVHPEITWSLQDVVAFNNKAKLSGAHTKHTNNM